MKKEENLDNYDQAYESTFKYNDENSYFLTRYAEYVINIIRSVNAKNVLSLGIGHHIVSNMLASELGNGVKSYEILEGSKSIIDKFKLSISDADRLSLIHTYFENFDTSKKYDVIEMGFVLEHVNDPGLIVGKYKEFLSPKGKMLISVPNARSLHRQIGYESGILKSLYDLSKYDTQLGHKRYFDIEMLSSIIINAGLNIDNVIGLLLKPITTEQMQKLNWNSHIMNALIKIGETNPELSNCFLIESSI